MRQGARFELDEPGIEYGNRHLRPLSASSEYFSASKLAVNHQWPAVSGEIEKLVFRLRPEVYLP